MSSEVTVALLNFIPALLWVLLVAILIAIYHKPIRGLISRTGGLKIGGVVELTFIQQEFQVVAAKKSLEISGSQGLLVGRRAQRVAQIIQGAQILWVDDKQSEIISERRILHYLGIFVDVARTSTEALSMIPQQEYDAVISNIARPDLGEERIDKFLADIRKQDPKLSSSTIFYVGNLRPGVPPYAFGITNRPDELIHLVLDILERKRS